MTEGNVAVPSLDLRPGDVFERGYKDKTSTSYMLNGGRGDVYTFVDYARVDGVDHWLVLGNDRKPMFLSPVPPSYKQDRIIQRCGEPPKALLHGGQRPEPHVIPCEDPQCPTHVWHGHSSEAR